MKCKICTREAVEDEFCQRHLMAYQNIVEKFSVWKKALSVSWNQYLGQIQKNSLTGEWAKEVAKSLIEEEDQECL